jgi:hypothetical protein
MKSILRLIRLIHGAGWCVLGLLLVLGLSVPAWASQSLNGELTGNFTGRATDGSAEFTGVISGQWSASATAGPSGLSVETVSGTGTFGGIGLSGTWTMASYDPLTNTIHVSWMAPGERGPLSAAGVADGAVTLVVDTARGIATGDFTGQAFTPAGTKTITGTWTVQFQGLANGTISGRVAGQFSGSASYVGAVSGTVSGDWSVRVLADGSVAGSASGTYDGGSIAIPGYGSICICGTWLANVSQGENGQYRLEGGWTHPVVSGNLEGSGGGPLVWYLDVSTTPIQASGDFSGRVGFVVSVPVLGTMSVPVSVNGSWTATLPINP